MAPHAPEGAQPVLVLSPRLYQGDLLARSIGKRTHDANFESKTMDVSFDAYSDICALLSASCFRFRTTWNILFYLILIAHAMCLELHIHTAHDFLFDRVFTTLACIRWRSTSHNLFKALIFTKNKVLLLFLSFCEQIVLLANMLTNFPWRTFQMSARGSRIIQTLCINSFVRKMNFDLSKNKIVIVHTVTDSILRT